MASEDKPKKTKKDKRTSWLARSGSRDGAISRKSERASYAATGSSGDVGAASSVAAAASVGSGGSGTSGSGGVGAQQDPNKKWHKGDVMSPEVLARQRNLEQFLLKFEMKRLRGTSWLYYDISTTPEDHLSLSSGLPPPSSSNNNPPPVLITGSSTPPLSSSPNTPSALSSSPATSSSLPSSSSSSAVSSTNPTLILTSDTSHPGPDESPPSPEKDETAVGETGGSSALRLRPPKSPLHGHELSQSVGVLGGDQKEKELIIVVPAGGVRPEAMFEHIIGFAGRGFRVITPRIPETLDDFEDYSAGLCLIMRQEKVGRAHFFGLGMGGMIVQHLIYRYPERVLTATLAHTTPPNEELMARCVKVAKEKQFGSDVLSSYLLGYKIKERDLDSNMRKIRGDEKTLWLVFMKQFQISKSAAAVYTQALINYHRDFAYIPADFKRFKGDLFLIESQMPEYAEALEEQRILFPSATVFLYPNNGPLYSLVRGNKTAQRVVEFIRQSRAIRKRRKAEKEGEKLLLGSSPKPDQPSPLQEKKKSRSHRDRD